MPMVQKLTNLTFGFRPPIDELGGLLLNPNNIYNYGRKY